MAGFTQKYTIIQLFEPMNIGVQFSSDNWPLHSTLLDTFAIEWGITEMVQRLTDMSTSLKTAHTIAEDDTFFGSEKQTRVTLLQKTKNLTELHHSIVALLDQDGLKLNDPQFARDGFLPHATVQKHARLHKGDEVLFTALTIIDMFPDDNPYERRVLATIPLRG